jgi:hypothetical protein
MAEARVSRTHRCPKRTTAGFEDREDHRIPKRSHSLQHRIWLFMIRDMATLSDPVTSASGVRLTKNPAIGLIKAG